MNEPPPHDVPDRGPEIVVTAPRQDSCGTACECDHDFVLVLTGVSELTSEVMNALFEAGCDDATPSVRHGRIYLTFSRTAGSYEAAVISAIRDVRSARIGADVF